jgi:hypothetical protein
MPAPSTPTARNLHRLLLLTASIAVGGILWLVLDESEAMVTEESGGQWVLARVDGVAITETEVLEAADAELRQLEARRLEILGGHLDARVRALLLEAAARRRGVSPEQFLAAEVAARLAEIPQARVDAYYEARKDVLGRPQEEVGVQIRELLAREDLFARLAASGDVEVVDGGLARLLTGA